MSGRGPSCKYTHFSMWSFGSATANLSFQLPKIILGDTFTEYFRWLNKDVHESWFEEYKYFNIRDNLSGTQIKIKRNKLFHVPGNPETICLRIVQRRKPTLNAIKINLMQAWKRKSTLPWRKIKIQILEVRSVKIIRRVIRSVSYQ